MFLTPHDPISCALKRVLMRLRGAKIGARVKIWRDVWVDHYSKVQIADDVTIGKSVNMICDGNISIGNRVMIAHGAQIISSGHNIKPKAEEESMRFTGLHSAPVKIADDVWIGAGAIILPGVSIGKAAVVAAGAVVSKSVGDFEIVGGVPAKTIKVRD